VKKRAAESQNTMSTQRQEKSFFASFFSKKEGLA